MSGENQQAPATPLPPVSVVIATYGRRDRLGDLLPPVLADPATAEVVVVVDGSDDGSIELLRRWSLTDPRIVPVWQANTGPAGARDRGVRAATSETVLLLDDDVIAAPGLVTGHARNHADREDLVVVGYMPTHPPQPRLPGQFASHLYAQEYERECRDYEADPHGILTSLWGGNVSMRRADALRAGMAGSRRLDHHEDTEFGLRCRALGLQAVFDRSLNGTHLHNQSLTTFTQAARTAGAAQTVLEAEYPGLAVESPGLPWGVRSIVAFAAADRMYPASTRCLAAVVVRAGQARWWWAETTAARLLRQIEVAYGARNVEAHEGGAHEGGDSLAAAPPAKTATAETATDVAFSPVGIIDVELTQPLPNLAAGTYDRYQVLVRLHTEPLGIVDIDRRDGDPVGLAAAIWTELADPIRLRAQPRPANEARRPGIEQEEISLGQLADGLDLNPLDSGYVRRRTEVLAGAPLISVVLCTRDRADRLDGTLERLAGQQYPRFEVIVVDNASTTDAVRATVSRWAARMTCRYVPEPTPGLSRARNTGARAARGRMIAFLDDDERADPYWLAELARAAADHDGVGCVSGLILPAELETRAQEWFEQFGGHAKGRAFTSTVFDAHGPQSPLYPLPPFGAGGNMMFTRTALDRIGGFDPALGSGTPARGSEDTLAFSRVLLAGYRMVYQPSAIVRHQHYADAAGLENQLFGYGTGLTAAYAALLRHDPGLVWPLLRLVPTGLRDLFGRGSTRTATMRDFPPALARRELLGMLSGPFAYVRSRAAQRRLAATGKENP
jgi:glycosyltransferase involved in cell wall biosynthesis